MKTPEQAAQEAAERLFQVGLISFWDHTRAQSVMSDAIRPFAEEIARLGQTLKTLRETRQRELDQHLEQLAAARDVLAKLKREQWGMEWNHWSGHAIIDAALATPCPAADALLEDRARLDWLERQSNGSSWVARQSVTGRGFRLHNTGADDSWNGAECRGTARAAIDAARKEGPQ